LNRGGQKKAPRFFILIENMNDRISSDVMVSISWLSKQTFLFWIKKFDNKNRNLLNVNEKNRNVPNMGTFMLTNLWEPIKLCM